MPFFHANWEQSDVGCQEFKINGEKCKENKPTRDESQTYYMGWHDMNSNIYHMFTFKNDNRYFDNIILQGGIPQQHMHGLVRFH